MLQHLFIAVISSSVVSGIFVFFIRSVLSKWLDQEFNKRHAELEQKIKTANKTEEMFRDARLGLYPQLIEVTYRLRNEMREAISSQSAIHWTGNVRQYSIQLTEDLFKYRMFLPNEIFELLHKFKHIAQDAVLLGDTFTRDDKIDDTEGYAKAIDNFHPKLEQANTLFDEIKRAVGSHLQTMRDLR